MLAESFRRNKSVKVLYYSDDSMTMDTMLQFLGLLTEAYTLEEVTLKVYVDPNDNQHFARVENAPKPLTN